jgi:hypothetical protein
LFQIFKRQVLVLDVNFVYGDADDDFDMLSRLETHYSKLHPTIASKPDGMFLRKAQGVTLTMAQATASCSFSPRFSVFHVHSEFVEGLI